MREKLVELICSTEYGNGSLIGNNFQKGFIEKIADHLIANGVTIQKWIPVSERLPMTDEVGEFVLVYTHENKHLIVTCWAAHKHKEQIVCWMPLPEPPKGE